MKYFILIIITLVSLFILSSCGLIRVGSIDKETSKLAKEYGGYYVFDKKLKDEIKQREKEREEYRKSRLETIDKEKGKLLRTFFTEKEIQDYEDMIERDKRRRGVVISYSYHPVYKKEQEILKELNKKYPYSLIDEKFQILSNGCKYGERFGVREDPDLSPHFEKIKEYMGEEAYDRIRHSKTTYYIDKNNKKIPIEIQMWTTNKVTTFNIHGDEAAGVRWTETDYVEVSGWHIFYLENGKFIKSDEKR